MTTQKNKLYYGDNYEVLQRYVKDETVDLVYLDPPFNSRREYAVLFAEKDGSQSSSQIHAFEDTWEWNIDAQRSYEHIVEQGGQVADTMRAFWTFLHGTDMMAYLAMMAPRLVELRRVLKPTGSIYLHCDPTASHYLKILMDAVFGPQFFRNEISWRRSSAHSDVKQGMKRCGRVRDVLLFYSMGQINTWNLVYTPYSEDYQESEYRHVTDEKRQYKETDLTAARPGGDTSFCGGSNPDKARRKSGNLTSITNTRIRRMAGNTRASRPTTVVIGPIRIRTLLNSRGQERSSTAKQECRA